MENCRRQSPRGFKIRLQAISTSSREKLSGGDEKNTGDEVFNFPGRGKKERKSLPLLKSCERETGATRTRKHIRKKIV